MKKLSLISILIVAFTIGTFNIVSAKPGNVNPGQAKKQQVTKKAKVAPGQSKKTVTKTLPTVIKTGRFQLPVNPIVKDLGAKVERLSSTEIKITKDTSVVIMIKITPDVKKSTVVEINSTISGVAAYKKFTQKGNGVINPTSYIKSLLKAVPTPTPTSTPTPTTTPLPNVDRPTIIDKIGSEYNGQGIIRLPAALEKDSYVFGPIQDSAIIAPVFGADLSGWRKVKDGDTIDFNKLTASPNGKHLGIAEVNNSHQLVRFFDIIISGIADYSPATPGTYTGVRIYANIAAFNSALGDCSLTNKTIVLTINGVDKTIVFNRNYNIDAFTSWTAVNDFVVKSENLNGTAIFTGADSAGLKFTTVIIPNIAGAVILKTDTFGLVGVGTAVTGTAEAN